MSSIFQADRVELIAGMDAAEVASALERLNRCGDVSNYGLAFYLNNLDSRRACQLLGFPTATAFAMARLKMGKSRAYELVAVGRALTELRMIDAAISGGSLSWTQVRLLARVATPDTEEEWLELALRVPPDELKWRVAAARRGERPRPNGKGIRNVRLEIKATVDPVVYEAWQRLRAKVQAERGERLSDAEMLASVIWPMLETRPDGTIPGRERETEASAQLVGVRCTDCGQAKLLTQGGAIPLDDASLATLKERAEETVLDAERFQDVPPPREGELAPKTPPAMRNYVLARDGFRCVHCGARGTLHAHHIQWRSLGGPTSPENMTTLCDLCHGLVHEGFLHVTGTAPDRITFTDKDGRPITDALRAELPITVKAASIQGEDPAGRASATEGPNASSTGPADSAAAESGRGVVGLVTFDTLPNAVDARWWHEHAHLFDWNTRREVFEFQPGNAAAAAPKKAKATVPERNSAFRPESLDEIRGQERTVRVLRRAAQAARIQGRAARHVLIEGAAGLVSYCYTSPSSARKGKSAC